MMKKILVFSSIIGFVSLVVVISSLYMSDDALTHDGHIPDNIGAFTLVTKIEGVEAKQILSKIHGRDADLDQAYVLEYQTQGDAYSIVWISELNETNALDELYEDVEKIIEKNNIYSNQEQRDIGNKSVLYAEGKKSDNYYFVSENRFILVTTFEDKKARFIKNAVKVF